MHVFCPLPVASYLALVAALAAEADYVFVPEWPPEEGWEEEMCTKLQSVSDQLCIESLPWAAALGKMFNAGIMGNLLIISKAAAQHC